MLPNNECCLLKGSFRLLCSVKSFCFLVQLLLAYHRTIWPTVYVVLLQSLKISMSTAQGPFLKAELPFVAFCSWAALLLITESQWPSASTQSCKIGDLRRGNQLSLSARNQHFLQSLVFRKDGIMIALKSNKKKTRDS